ncbi:helix-turn-helix domain-containing protein [Lysinibacillus sp. G4S2]|uniref:helix-turn-helix domain-containing protein n=1 Tax=Lysinibacillus sp. G4S2 TaxID=3055859 RepID=UPI0025A0DE3C|nr:helix-turn-helix domain-containing protein [Lysinibacillus sp. G4S2]MDM5250814.1 helix-turn-helix domain-containing protein [Lysinibacillus sp. G4S2]
MGNLKTINEICEEYSISRKTVERWMNTGLPYVKLNSNNGSVRIKEEDVQKMINGMTNENPINRMRWGEFQAKLAISQDLFEDRQHNLSSKIEFYDEFKLSYPQDFYVIIGETNVLINVSSIDSKHFDSFSLEEQEKIFKRKFFVEEQNLKLIIILVGFNDNLDSNKYIFNSSNIVNMVAVNLRDITNLDIMKYLTQY